MNLNIFSEAEKLYGRMKEYSSYLKNNAESGFDLEKTYNYVFDKLTQLGLSPKKCGKCGIYADVYGQKKGGLFLLRADMDALKGIDNENCEKITHACGHHLHTSMLLGAAEILKKNSDKLCGAVRLMFQPAEEILEGAKDMISGGVLEPRPDAAMMIHVLSGVELPCGSVVVSSGGISAPAADFFRINVQGKGTHGALSHQGIDALSVAAYTITALNEIKARELAIDEIAAITVGKLEGAHVANVIPDNVYIEGSTRSFDEKLREKIKERICKISENIALAFRAEAEVSFIRGCPTLKNDERLSKFTFESLREIMGSENVIRSDSVDRPNLNGGSEDFSYVSQVIPSIMIGVCAGDKKDGYVEPLHHPKVRFDERALVVGAAAYTCVAMNFLSGKE